MCGLAHGMGDKQAVPKIADATLDGLSYIRTGSRFAVSLCGTIDRDKALKGCPE
jgi:hypothetical protein